MIENPQLDLAYAFVNDTNTNLYLTGKAGTGKTTFLKKVKDEIPKRCAVVAPTGVAAINAEGVTIHSLFQLSFGPNVPGMKKDKRQRRFSKRKINLLKSLDLLIIDEISMVRSDILDAIDEVLRRYRNSPQPFGGVQLLMIGDLHQLPPVVANNEWNLLRQHYETPYFFGSHALKKSDVVKIELKHIYRQESENFIDLLNKVRDNKLDSSVLKTLNSRYDPNFSPEEEEGYITLTSHNNTANKINKDKLEELEKEAHTFIADIEGEFPEHSYPTEPELELKVDAQVMFVKNDPTEEKRFYNGKIGRIVEIGEHEVTVSCPGDDESIMVGRLTWENRKFKLNESTKEVEEQVIGTFEQFPLKLAWAITIHKSQGLTFEKVVIDAADAFAHGQVYVALSRCKTFEGIVLRTKIAERSVQTDAVVQGYTRSIQENEPDQGELEQRRRAYQCHQLIDVFRFAEVERWSGILKRAVMMNERSLVGDAVKGLNSIVGPLENQVVRVGKKFTSEISKHCEESELPETNKDLVRRLKKAGGYFLEKLEEIQNELEELDLMSDNSKVKADIDEKKETLLKELHKSWAQVKACAEGHTSNKLNRVRADAELDYEKKRSKKPSSEKSGRKFKIPSEIEHRDLFRSLVEWRRDTSAASGLPAYRILSTKAILEVSNVLPTDGKALGKVNGIGKVKLEQFGEEILDMVAQYIEEKEIKQTDKLDLASGPTVKKKKKKPKKDTKEVSYEMYKSGKSIKEIAEERDFVESTIMSHLTHYVKEGELELTDFVSEEKVEKIRAYYKEHRPKSMKDAKSYFGDEVTYGELRMVVSAKETK